MRTPALVVFGSLTIDNVVRAWGEILPQSFGGNAVYAALGARVWSDAVGIVSRCGDGYAEAALERLRRAGIDTDGIRRVPGAHRMNVAFAYRPDGSRTRTIPPPLLDRMGAADRQRFFDSSTRPDGHATMLDFAPDAADMPVAWWDGVAGLHCPSIPLERMVAIAAAACARPGPPWVGVDSPWHDNLVRRGADVADLLPRVDALLPSEQDMENYRPGVPHDAVARDLIRDGAAAVVLKRGPAGCRIYEPDRTTDIPAVPVEAVDPTGAGDSFCGGLLAGVALTRDLRAAAHYGTVSASFCVERPDLQGMLAVDAGEARRRLAALSSRTGITVEAIGETSR